MQVESKWKFTLDEIDNVASNLIKSYPDARVLALYGEMGSGKTTFIKALCRYFKVDQVVTSPTFAIVNEYRDKYGKNSYFHFDFYRIENIEEAMDIGYEDYFYSNHKCFVEWPGRIEELLPEGALKLLIKVIDNGKRELLVI